MDGISGFCSTGDSVMQGYLDLWDQLAALSWVSQEIRNFGGDQTDHCLGILGAGSRSVSVLTLRHVARENLIQLGW